MLRPLPHNKPVPVVQPQHRRPLPPTSLLRPSPLPRPLVHRPQPQIPPGCRLPNVLVPLPKQPKLHAKAVHLVHLQLRLQPKLHQHL